MKNILQNVIKNVALNIVLAKKNSILSILKN
jgi:hypothetical protein